MRRATSGSTLVKGRATIPAGALAHGVAAAPQVVTPVAPSNPGDQVIIIRPAAALPGLWVEGVVTAANTVTIYAYCVALGGVVVPAAYEVQFEIAPQIP